MVYQKRQTTSENMRQRIMKTYTAINLEIIRWTRDSTIQRLQLIQIIIISKIFITCYILHIAFY